MNQIKQIDVIVKLVIVNRIKLKWILIKYNKHILMIY